MEHYRILYRDNQLTIDEEGFFRNLDELVKVKETKQVVVNGGLSLCSRWLHVKISREETEKLLQPPMDGLFLIRPSIRHPGDYTLSVSYSSGVEHYRIKYKGNRFTIDDEIFFCNLEELVKVKPRLSRRCLFLSRRFAVAAFISLLISHLLQAVQRPPQPQFQ